MSFDTKRLYVLGLALVVGLAACDDSNGPGNGEFDAAETSANLEAMEATFETEAFRSLAAVGSNFQTGPAAFASATARVVQDAHVRTGAGDRAIRQARDLQALAAQAIPTELYGNSYVYSVEEEHYVLGEGEDAPENGVRVILYAVSPVSGEIVADPLTEIGYLDIIDLDPDAGNQVAVQLIVVSEGVTYADYTASATLGGGQGIGLAVTLDGMITDGENTAEFTLTHAANVDFESAQVMVDYEVEVPELDFGLTVDLDVVGQEGSAETTVEVLVTGEGNFARLAGSFTEEGGEVEVFVGAGSGGEGDLFAIITVSPTSVTVTDAEGEALTQEERETLQRIFEVIEDALDVFEDLFGPVEWAFDGE
jgi:hypothetical protein